MNLYTQRLNILPHIVFFEPNSNFIEYIKENIPNKMVVDVGAGCGYLSSILFKEGFKVLAIDIIKRDNSFYPVHLLDATEMNYPNNIIPIMARPCHNDWVELSIRKALETVKFFLYVGLEKNIIDDLSGLGKEFQLKQEDFCAGNEDEIVIKISKIC